MTREAAHQKLLVNCDSVNTTLTKLIEELDRKPLDIDTQTRIAKAINGKV